MKYLLLLLPALWALGLAGQSSPNFCSDPNWDWTNDSAQNWTAYLTDYQSYKNLGSPFDPQSPSGSSPVFDNIIRAQDFTPAKGWRLVLRDFGCETPADWPYFVLYNKYTGILRVFVWARTTGMENGAMLTISWNPSFQKMLALPSKYGTEYAAETAKAQGIFGGDIRHVLIDGFCQNAWFMIEQPLQFDPTINPSSTTDCLQSYVIHIMRHVIFLESTPKGLLTTVAPKKSIMLQVPGTKQFERGGKSLYHEPVGVVALEKEPQLQIRKWTSTYVPYMFNPAYKSYFSQWDPNYALLSMGKSEQWGFKSVRIASPPVLALNKYANLRVKEAKAMITARIRNKPDTSEPAYSFQNTPIPHFEHAAILPGQSVSGIGYRLIHKDPVAHYLKQDAYRMNTAGEDGRIEFSTGMVDLSEIAGTSITVREETDLFLKVLYVLEPTDAEASKAPIYKWALYNITQDTETEVGIDEPYSFTNEQLRNATGTFEAWNYGIGDREGRSAAYPSPSNPYDIIDRAHFDRNNAFGIMNPELSTQSPAGTLGKKILPLPASITPLESMFFERDCKCPGSEKAYYKSTPLTDLPAEAKTLPFQLSVRPNPASREIALSISGGDAHITLSDMSGRSCMEWDAQAGNTTANVSALAQGVYIIQAVSAKGSASTRLIKQ